MNKIWLITKREFLSRVKKPGFIIMSVLGPILIAVFFSLVIYFSSHETTEVRKIAVVDSTGIFMKKIPDTRFVQFDYLINIKVDNLKRILKKTDYYGILYISPIVSYSSRGVQLYSYHHPGFYITQHIEAAMAKELRNQKLMSFNIKNIDNILKSVETSVEVETIKISDSGETKGGNKDVKQWVAYISSLLIFLFIFSFGVRVMRGIIEEKTNRIVEVIISSVKPFQLMMGKVVGVALTALTQFVIWIALTFVFISFAESAFIPDMSAASVASQPQNIMDRSRPVMQVQGLPQVRPELGEAFEIIDSIDFYIIIGSFIFYFIAGYLLYASLFAAIGAIVDVDSDNQQFVLPVILPLMLGIFIMFMVILNPESRIAFWFSLIPFTSPIVMMARIAYGVPYWQIALSMILLILTFLGTIWLAGKIYRTGILMYGKKVSLREMFRWVRYKD
jgi:ABC-2 type transport system permease protein